MATPAVGAGGRSRPRSISERIAAIRRQLPPRNFITVHYTYFILTSLVCSGIMYGMARPVGSVDYVDSLFLVVSAMTLAGLNTINLSTLNTGQQALLFILTMAGSTIWVSVWTVLFRRRAFEKSFDEIVKAYRSRERHVSWSANLGVLTRARSRSVGLGMVGPGWASMGPIVEGGAHLPETDNGGRSPGGPGKAPDESTVMSDPLAEPTRGMGSDRGEEGVGKAGEKDGSSAERETDSIGEGRHITVLDTGTTLEKVTSADDRLGDRHIQFAERASHRDPSRTEPAQHANGDAQRQTQLPPLQRLGTSHSMTNPSARLATPTLDILVEKVGRNAQFHSLTAEERDWVGGVEYRALTLLAFLVPAYFLIWQLLGFLVLAAWISQEAKELVQKNGLNSWWLGAFNAVSAFNNNGMSLLDDNVIPFQNSVVVLGTMGILILAGNTAYPIFLRLLIWIGLQALRFIDRHRARFGVGPPPPLAPTPQGPTLGGLPSVHEDELTAWIATLAYILHYPRRVYTNLFPSRPTWWLLFMLVALNGIDWLAFELLNLGNPVVTALPPGTRALDGLFQALAVRSGGFYVVPISLLPLGLLVLYVIMMYISVYPVVITMRHSNVYQERSLGIYREDSRSRAAGGERDDDSEDTSNDSSSDEADALPNGADRGRRSREGRQEDPERGQTSASAPSRQSVSRRLSRQGTRGVRAIRGALPSFDGVGIPPARHRRGRSNTQRRQDEEPGPSTSSKAVTATPRADHESPRRRHHHRASSAAPESRISFVRQQMAGQLAHDMWWLAGALFLIAVLETPAYEADPVSHSLFNMLFELVSAYGCVGISVGVPSDKYSFCGSWRAASKLVLCAVMIRGRHRGLPVALDRAVRLPSKGMGALEEEEAARIRARKAEDRGRAREAR